MDEYTVKLKTIPEKYRLFSVSFNVTVSDWFVTPAAMFSVKTFPLKVVNGLDVPTDWIINAFETELENVASTWALKSGKRGGRTGNVAVEIVNTVSQARR